MRTYRPEPDVKFVQANGLRFGYLEAGEGPLVLLMHGFPDTAHSWDDVRPRLAEAGFRAVTPFMRGYAPTEIPKGDRYYAKHLGGDVVGLIEALGEEKAVVVGHDWGAFGSYAAANLAPEKLTKLVIVGIPHPATMKPTPRLAWGVRHFVTLRLPGAARRFARRDFAEMKVLYDRWSPTWDAPPEELEATKNALSAPGSCHAALGYYRCLTPVVPGLLRKRIQVPTLIFAGLDDSIVEPSVYERGARMFTKGYEVVSLPGGHFLHRESPDGFAEALLRFLRE